MSTMPGNREWFRVVELVVGAQGQGIDVANLRVHFEIIKSVDATPNTATIKVYNLHPRNVELIRDVYKDVFLNAGYYGAVSQIFGGNIQYVSYYRDKADTITEITGADGDRDYRHAYINHTLAAGSNDMDVVRACVGTMAKTRLANETDAQVTTNKRLRGKVLQGPTREVLSQVARSNMCNWSIQDGNLQIIQVDSRLPGQAIVVSAETGLLEAPERNDKGISAKCLLNPNIVINAAIKLDNQAIRVKQLKQHALKTPTQSSGAPVPLNKDGIYKVIKLTHSGDTRDNEWYTTLECIGLGQPIPTARSVTTVAGVPNEGFAADDFFFPGTRSGS
jgi:hypothetical protein